jgi:hypothetical protein
VVKGSANGQDDNGTNNGANGGITVNGNQPAGYQISQNGICRVK